MTKQSIASIACLALMVAVLAVAEPVCNFFDSLPAPATASVLFGGFMLAAAVMVNHEIKEAER